VKREHNDRSVGDPTPDEPDALGDARRVPAAVKRIERGADESPQRVRAEAYYDGEQHHLADRAAREDDEAA